MYLYHGTDAKSAENIVKSGIDMNKSDKGYFGRGFYTATDEKLAKSNYADFADDEDAPGVVLKFQLNSNAKILDLDNPEDWDEYKSTTWKGIPITELRHRDDFDNVMTDLEIDGIRDEGSFGGIVIYNPDVIKLVEEIKFASENIALQFLANYTGKRIKIAAIDLTPLKEEAKKYKNGEELLRSGGFSIDALDRAAFGFAAEDIKELDPKDLHIKWKDDMHNVKQEIKDSGLTDEEWSETVNLSEPIEVVYEDGKFYIDDGHHRYWAAKTLGKKLKVDLVRIYDKPIAKITGKRDYDYDEFHRSFFASIRNADFQDLSSLKRYLKDKPFHIYDHAHEFDSYSNKDEMMEKAGVSEESWDKAMDESDWDELEELSDKISKSMDDKDKEDFLYHLHNVSSEEAPSWAHMDFEEMVLPSGSWLVHFSDNADEIKAEGFTYGIDQMDKLGLTTYFGKESKKYGGYNFAFLADSRDASHAAKAGKYGKEAVLFKASGLKVYHYGDQETQIIFYGKDINPDNIVLIRKDGDMWQVQGGERGYLFESENFNDVVNWVEKNHSQYAKALR